MTGVQTCALPIYSDSDTDADSDAGADAGVAMIYDMRYEIINF